MSDIFNLYCVKICQTEREYDYKMFTLKMFSKQATDTSKIWSVA